MMSTRLVAALVLLALVTRLSASDPPVFISLPTGQLVVKGWSKFDGQARGSIYVFGAPTDETGNAVVLPTARSVMGTGPTGNSAAIGELVDGFAWMRLAEADAPAMPQSAGLVQVALTRPADVAALLYDAVVRRTNDKKLALDFVSALEQLDLEPLLVARLVASAERAIRERNRNKVAGEFIAAQGGGTKGLLVDPILDELWETAVGDDFEVARENADRPLADRIKLFIQSINEAKPVNKQIEALVSVIDGLDMLTGDPAIQFQSFMPLFTYPLFLTRRSASGARGTELIVIVQDHPIDMDGQNPGDGTNGEAAGDQDATVEKSCTVWYVYPGPEAGGGLPADVGFHRWDDSMGQPFPQLEDVVLLPGHLVRLDLVRKKIQNFDPLWYVTAAPVSKSLADLNQAADKALIKDIRAAYAAACEALEMIDGDAPTSKTTFGALTLECPPDEQ